VAVHLTAHGQRGMGAAQGVARWVYRFHAGFSVPSLKILRYGAYE
jgi:hypothetical protein